MQYRNPKKVRRIPKQIGDSAIDALEKINQTGRINDIWAKKLKAIVLCYLEKKTSEEIGAELNGISTQTISTWFSEIVGPYCREDNEQAIVRAVHIIEGRTNACFKFEDAYNESSREKYVVGGKSQAECVKQGRREFRGTMKKAGINLACFTGKNDELYFNEDGKMLAIDALNNRTKRNEKDQNRKVYEVYQDIRVGYFPSKHKWHYEWMLEKACSNLRDLRKAYPDIVFHEEEDIREEFWRNTCQRNNGFDAFPGMSILGKLPWQISECWFLIFEDFLYLDQFILKEFSDSKSWEDKEKLERKERWITYLLRVFTIRCYEHRILMDEMTQYSLKELDDFKWLLDYLLGYENEYEDEYKTKGISLAKEEKWASRELAEDKRLNTQVHAMRRNIEKKNLEEESDASKAARIFLDWAPKALEITRRLSVEDIVECANMLLDPEQNLVEGQCQVTDDG